MTFSKYQIRFIDSYLFMVEPLKNLSDTYNIDTLKGYFPHHFNINENQNYNGKIPSPEHFGVRNMKVKDNENFYKWYDNQKDITYLNFQEEIKKYCRADTELLSKAVLKFRLLFF